MLKKALRFTHNPIPRILGLKDGIIYFQCVCGRNDTCHIRKFNRLTRCSKCEEDNLKLFKNRVTITKEQLKDLFYELYSLVLEDYFKKIKKVSK